MKSFVEAGVCLSGAGDFVGVVCECDWSRDSLGGDVCEVVFCGVLWAEIAGAESGFMTDACKEVNKFHVYVSVYNF